MSAEPAAKRLKTDGEPGAEADADAGPALTDEAQQKLLDVQREITKLNDACDEEVLQVQSKYNRKRQPLYSERADVIRTVPGFWRRALVNHGQLSSQLTDEDLEVLAYCMEIRVEDFEPLKSGYKIILTFAEANPYFPERELSKTFRFDEASNATTVEGTAPTWNEGREQVVYDEGDEGSAHRYEFFEWLGYSEECELDCMAEWIRDDIWPDPLPYYSAPGDEGDDVDVDEGEAGLDDAEADEAYGAMAGELLAEGVEGEEGLAYAEGDEGEEEFDDEGAAGDEGEVLVEGVEGVEYEGEGEEFGGEAEQGDGY